MSRTDKDAPQWVQAQWWVPVHCHACEFNIPSYYGPRPDRKPCTLPAEPVRRDSPRLPMRGGLTECIWEAEWWHKSERCRYRYTRRPRQKEIHQNWWGPDRSHTRDVLAHARKQYLASGDIDVPEPVRQHKHHPISGGWWD